MRKTGALNQQMDKDYDAGWMGWGKHKRQRLENMKQQLLIEEVKVDGMALRQQKLGTSGGVALGVN